MTVLEWADFLEDLLPEDLIRLTITKGDGDERTLTLAGTGPRAEERLKELMNSCPTSH